MSRKLMMSFVARLGVMLPMLVGCGDGGESPLVDAGPPPDAPNCTAEPSYESGVVDFASDSPTGGPAGMRRILVMLDVPSPGLQDRVILELHAGRGVFAGGDIVPGTYALGGAEGTYSTCGTCVVVGTNYHPVGTNGLDYEEYYLAQSGTITLTQTSGRLTGSLSDVTLEHVLHEPGMLPSDVPANDGCTTTIPSFSFDAAL